MQVAVLAQARDGDAQRVPGHRHGVHVRRQRGHAARHGAEQIRRRGQRPMQISDFIGCFIITKVNGFQSLDCTELDEL